MPTHENTGLKPCVTPNHFKVAHIMQSSQLERFCSGFGQFHTNEADPDKPRKVLKPYVAIDLAGIRALVDEPQRVDKPQARWLIPSTLMSRNFAKQEAEGEFWFLWADLDDSPKPLNEVEAILCEVIPDSDFEVYTSRSAKEHHQKARILIPLSKPLSGPDGKLCQELLNDKLDECGLTPDRATERAAQLCYLPNRGEFYDSRSLREGGHFNPLQAWSAEIEAKRLAIADATQAMQIASKAAAVRREALKMKGKNPNLIGAFNDAYTVQDILLRAEYKQRGNTFRHPQSESGSFSASVNDSRVHSLSRRDPLYTGGRGVGAHDAFSAFTVLFADSDRDKALKLAGDEWISFRGEPWNCQRHAKNNAELVNGDISAFFDDCTLNSEDVRKMTDAEFLIPNMIVRGHVAAYVSPGNGGKTTIFIYLCEKLSAMGLTVLYINVDGSPGDLKRHYAHAEKHGYKVIAPDAKDGKSTDDVLSKLKSIAAGSASCDKILFIIDTLKKFLDVINKKEAKEFYKLMRSITVKGATICLLGHTNKYKGEDGNHIFEGTADLRNDLDELIYLDSFNTGSTLEVTTRPDKVRAEFVPKSFLIHLPDRSVTEPECVLNILKKEDRNLLDLLKAAITEGQQSQKDIIDWVKSKTTHSDKRIRDALLRCSQGDTSEIKAERAGRAKDLCYSVRPNPFETIFVPARIVWTRFCNSGRLSEGISLTGFKG